VGDWARFGTKGVAHAFVTKGTLDVYWQWHVVSKHGASEKGSDELVTVLDNAFEASVIPAIKQSLKDSKLFGRLRQIHYCMILGTWFKQKYRHHRKVAKFLETGDPNQLTPTIQTVSSLSRTGEEGVKVIEVSAGEAVWLRAIELNNKALELRNEGRLEEAEPLLREALRMDEELRGPTDPKIAHRLNNLCTVLIMQGKFAEARENLRRAWSIKQRTGHDITSPRVLFVRLTLSLLETEGSGQFIGQIKFLLAVSELSDNASVTTTWDIAHFIENLLPKLPPGLADFLAKLANVLNDRIEPSQLDQLELWKNQPPVSLETPWPED
jgi:tetratricopeptide (TPR) repeat protein